MARVLFFPSLSSLGTFLLLFLCVHIYLIFVIDMTQISERPATVLSSDILYVFTTLLRANVNTGNFYWCWDLCIALCEECWWKKRGVPQSCGRSRGRCVNGNALRPSSRPSDRPTLSKRVGGFLVCDVCFFFVCFLFFCRMQNDDVITTKRQSDLIFFCLSVN